MSGAPLEAAIRLKQVGTGEPAAALLKDVRFKVEPGEIAVLLGPSGVGKTTTLRLLLGLDRKFEGIVNQGAGTVGVMFQEPRLLPWLTVAENIALVAPGRMDPGMIRRLLTLMELTGIEQRRPRELSLGMARRVALARALAPDPTLLILDEPFASLDVALANRISAFVATWARTHHATVLFTTHNLHEAINIADRILILAGRPASLAADYALPADAKSREASRLELLARFRFLSPDFSTASPEYP